MYPNGYRVPVNPFHQLRETLGLTQQQLANMAGTSQSACTESALALDHAS